MTAFDDLLEVQARDIAIDRLLHRRRTLPERQELAALQERIALLDTRLGETISRRDEVAARQGLMERDLAASEARIEAIDRRMYSGEVSASRDLQAMAGEIESLKRRVSGLEDHVLTIMDEREPLDDQVAALEREKAALEAEADTARHAIAAGEAVIDSEVVVEREAREAVAAGLPADLAATYERLRSRLGGIGAARLENGSCTGCHLRLSAIEADRLKRLPPDALAFCEQCGRILVRSAGAGAGEGPQPRPPS